VAGLLQEFARKTDWRGLHAIRGENGRGSRSGIACEQSQIETGLLEAASSSRKSEAARNISTGRM
jgi:hypothetical protein